MKIHVLASSIGSSSEAHRRRESLLGDLGKQTRKPDSVTVLGTEGTSFIHALSTCMLRSSLNDVLVMLEDDARVHPEFIETSIEWLQREGACVSWSPLSDEQILACYPGIYVRCLSGADVLRAQWIQDIHEHRLAPKHLASNANRALFISWFLWQRGIPIVCPALRGLIEHQPYAQAEAWQLAELEAEFGGWTPTTIGARRIT